MRSSSQRQPRDKTVIDSRGVRMHKSNLTHARAWPPVRPLFNPFAGLMAFVNTFPFAGIYVEAELRRVTVDAKFLELLLAIKTFRRIFRDTNEQ